MDDIHCWVDIHDTISYNPASFKSLWYDKSYVKKNQFGLKDCKGPIKINGLKSL